MKNTPREHAQRDGVTLNEMDIFSNTLALIDWLLLVLVLYYLVLHRSVVNDNLIVLLAITTFAGLSLTWHYLGVVKNPTTILFTLEVWSMLLFTAVIVWQMGESSGLLFSLFYLPIISASIMLNRKTVCLQVLFVVFICYVTLNSGEDLLSFSVSRMNGLIEQTLPLILVAYVTTMLAIGMSETRAKLRSLSETDQLTNLLNMRAFHHCIEREIERASRHGYPFSLMMIDIDGLKAINDQYGHEIGNSVICNVADNIRVLLRTSDIVARYGGDEFLVLLVETDGERANYVAKRMQEHLFDNPLEAKGIKIASRASVGIATFPEDGVVSQALISHADRSMYIDKRGEKEH